MLKAFRPVGAERVCGVAVANADVAALLRQGPSKLNTLSARLEAEGTFAAQEHPSGLFVTSEIPENPEMGNRLWVTDACWSLALAARREPGRCTSILKVLAQFYGTVAERLAFVRAIGEPETYLRGGPSEGVAHVFLFDPASKALRRDPEWANNKRLESHALAAFVSALPEGSVPDEETERYAEAAVHLALYLASVGYASAPSAGCWEEMPFPGGLTWDAEAGREAFVALGRWVRENRELAARWLEPPAAHLAAVLGRPELRSMVLDAGWHDEQAAKGEARLRAHPMAEAPGLREADASLALVAANRPIRDDGGGDPVSVAVERLEWLEKRVVRECGMLRYAPFSPAGASSPLPDSYLACNYWLALDEDGYLNSARLERIRAFGSRDASDPEVFAARAALAVPDREAEWFLVSEMGRGWLRVVRALREAPEAETGLLAHATEKAWEYVVRAAGRVTPASAGLKANGWPCPAWRVPEAYEWIRVHGELAGAAVVEGRLPGAHTPLTWAATSLLVQLEDAVATLGPGAAKR